MAEHVEGRTPIVELALLITGLASAMVAVQFEQEAWLVASILACIFSGLAAIATVMLAKRENMVQVAAVVLGALGAGFGLVWWLTHRNAPEVFSPTLIGYLGAGLALSATVTLAHRRLSSHV
jgi:hypothetical protein